MILPVLYSIKKSIIIIPLIRLQIKIKTAIIKYDYNAIGKTKTGLSDGVYYHARAISEKNSRVLHIRQTNKVEDTFSKIGGDTKIFSNKTAVAKMEEDKKSVSTPQIIFEDINNKDDIKLAVSIAGIGISVINHEPKELIYLNVFDISCDLEKNESIDPGDGIKTTTTSIALNIKKIQIDNMLEQSFPVIFSPQIVEEKKEEEEVCL